MELRHLRYFITLYEELHFTEAAFTLGISQPTLSQQIRVLEDAVGAPLFHRRGRTIAPTEAGKILYEHATQITRELAYANEAIQDVTAGARGLIRVAALPSDLDYRLTDALVAFDKRFPHVHVRIFPSVQIAEQVMNDEADIGIGLVQPATSSLVIEPFYEETYSLYVHTSDPLATRSSVAIDDVAQSDLLLFPPGFTGRQLLDDWASERGFTLAPKMETGSATSLLQLVNRAVGTTIQPASLINLPINESVRAIPIDDGPVRELALLYRSDHYQTRAKRALLQQLLETFHAPRPS